MLHPPVPETINQERPPEVALAYKYDLRSRWVSPLSINYGIRSPQGVEHWKSVFLLHGIGYLTFVFLVNPYPELMA